jgi:cell division initiation protein
MRGNVRPVNKIRMILALPALARRDRRTYVQSRFRPEGGPPMSDRLTAMDIENQEFARKVRGYDPEAVRLYLRSVGEEVQRLNLENADLKAANARLEEEIREIRDRELTLQATLISAQQMTEEMKDRARQEADLTLREARTRSERLLEQAQDQLARIEDEIRRARLERDAFENRLKGAVEEHLSLLELRKSERSDGDNLRFLHRKTGSDNG